MKNCCCGCIRWGFGGEFFKVGLGQHLGESLEKVLCKTHLEPWQEKKFWKYFDNNSIYSSKLFYKKRTPLFIGKKLRLTLACMISFLKTLQLENDKCQAMNGKDPLHWQDDRWQGAWEACVGVT